MSRNSQLSRTLRVLHYLELNPQGLRARDVLKKLTEDGFPVSRETVYRDFQGLQKANIAIFNEGTGDDAVWKLDSLVRIERGIQFSYKELIALFLARETLRALDRSSIFEAIESFFVKLEKALGPRAHEGLNTLSQSIKVEAAPGWIGKVSSEILDTIHAATSEGHVLEIEYRSVSGANANELKTRKVGPITLYFADAGAYLVAQDLSDQVTKHYALTRIHRAVMADEAFDAEGVVTDDFFTNGIGVFGEGKGEIVEVYIEEPVASYIADRIVHRSQKIELMPGGLTLTLEVRVNDELARWVLSLGAQAEVIQPDSLRSMVSKMAEQIVTRTRRKAV